LTGELIGIVHWNPSVVFRFTSDFKYYASDPQFGTPYTLLPDDSTLIFAYINNPSQPDHYDTNYITSITTNQLTLSSINRITNAIFKDTLRR